MGVWGGGTLKKMHRHEGAELAEISRVPYYHIAVAITINNLR